MSQHVSQRRGGKRERIACGGGTDCEVGRRTRLTQKKAFFHLLAKGCQCAVGCKASLKRSQQEKEGETIRMGHDHNGRMGERAKWRR